MNLNSHRLVQIYQTVKEQPGIKLTAIARQLGYDRATLYRALPLMDRYGLLLYEDERGGLHPFMEAYP